MILPQYIAGILICAVGALVLVLQISEWVREENRDPWPLIVFFNFLHFFRKNHTRLATIDQFPRQNFLLPLVIILFGAFMIRNS